MGQDVSPGVTTASLATSSSTLHPPHPPRQGLDSHRAIGLQSWKARGDCQVLPPGLLKSTLLAAQGHLANS